MKILMLATMLIITGSFFASDAEAATCRVVLEDGYDRVIDRFYGEGYNRREACDDALWQCDRELRRRQRRGELRYGSCQIARRPDRQDAEVDAYCFSIGRSTTTCSVEGRVRSVQLLRQISKTPCVFRNTWGISRDHIWVTNGCRGLFRIRYTPYGR